MHKSTLITYFISSLLKKHSIKKWWKAQSVHPHYSRPSSNIFQRNFIPVLLKTFQKKFLAIIDHSKLFDGTYPAIVFLKILQYLQEDTYVGVSF